MKTLDVVDALIYLDRAVARRGADYRYSDEFEKDLNVTGTCKYVINKKPACIVGDILVRDVHISVEDLSLLKNGSIAGGFGINLEDHEMLKLRPGAVFVLGRAQSHQDKKYTWGEAVEYAHDCLLEEYGEKARNESE